MARLRPTWMQPAGGDPAITYSAQEDRASLLAAVFSREGVLDVDAGQLRVQQRGAGANYSIDVTAGRAAIQGDDSSDQGTYIVTATTTENISTYSTGGAITKPGSGTRKHRVIARVRDKLHNGGVTQYDWVIEVLQDTGSGVPAQPNSAITLGYLNMTSSMTAIQTAHIEDARPRASVGSLDLQGTFDIHPALGTPDGTRPLRYQVNADGRVMLSGWRMRSAATVTYDPNVLYAITDIATGKVLPAVCRPSGIRDFVLASASGPVHAAVHANGEIYIRYMASTTVLQNSWWISFDGGVFLK